MKRFWLIVVLLLCRASGAASALVRDVSVWRSPSVTSLNEALATDTPFRPVPPGIPNLGYSSDTFWFRFPLPVAPETANFLEVRYPLDDIQIYYTTDGAHFELAKLGEGVVFSARPFKYRNHVVALPPAVKSPVYIRVRSQSSIQLPVTLWSGRELVEKINVEQFYLGLYFGLIAIMAVFNFLLFFLMRDSTFLCYSVFLAVYGVLQLSVNRLAPQFLWPNSLWLNMNSIPLTLGLSVAGLSWFAGTFLRVRRDTPVKWGMLWAAAAVALLSGSTIFVLPYRTSILLAFGGVFLSTLMVLAVLLASIKKGRPVLVFLVSWTPFVAGLWALMLKSLGILPATFASNYGVQLASTFGVLFFAVALADRFQALKAEKNLIQQEAREAQQKVQHHLALIEQAQQVAHDIRSPLAALEMLSMQMRGLPEADRRLIEGAIQRMRQIIDSLGQKYQNPETQNAIRLRPLPLRDLVDNVVKEKQIQYSAHPAQIQGDLRGAPGEYYSMVDRFDFERVLSNLINNAVEAMPEGGKVTVQMAAENGWNLVRVCDGGGGISEDILPRLTERGFSYGKKGGTGLGLYHAEKTVQVWGGKLKITSKAGEGTVVELRMPQVAPLEAQP